MGKKAGFLKISVGSHPDIELFRISSVVLKLWLNSYGVNLKPQLNDFLFNFTCLHQFLQLNYSAKWSIVLD